MKRIGGSRSYRRLSIEALKKKRGAVCCVYAKENETLFNRKGYLFIESLFSEARWRSGPTILSTFVQSTDAYTQREKNFLNWMGQSCCSAYNVYTHTDTHTWTGFSFLTFQLLTSSKENEPGRPSDKAKEVLLLFELLLFGPRLAHRTLDQWL